uniref:Uncharacterized protein n=1 Tax=Magnetospirillum gryphiswaldense TaxID=55518 RepID=A4TZ04_9PROT|nr:hypothetical protein MGR_1518 [Magnetospirillum gryphiswaldense MSR-1]
MSGQLLDATIVAAPKQRNTDGHLQKPWRFGRAFDSLTGSRL